MTTFQSELIEKLNAAKIEAAFKGDFLNCKVKVTAVDSGKVKWQKFSFVFESADDCQGSRWLPRSCKGAYSEHYAKTAGEIIKAHSDEIAQLPV